jgi:hypothetical protein
MTQPGASLAPDYSDRVLLTVHGITSDNSGLARMRDHCENALKGLIVDSFYYGHVIPFKELTEDTSYAVFLALRARLDLAYRDYLQSTNRKLYVAAHSFGTLATVRALEMRISGLSIEGLFLMGSVVPRYYYWDGLIDSGQLRHPPVSVVRPLDRIVRGAFAVGGGSSGASGFIANGRYRPLETFKGGGHTDYWKGDNEDLVTLIRDGPNAVPRTSRDDWISQAGFIEKLRYKFL